LCWINLYFIFELAILLIVYCSVVCHAVDVYVCNVIFIPVLLLLNVSPLCACVIPKPNMNKLLFGVANIFASTVCNKTIYIFFFCTNCNKIDGGKRMHVDEVPCTESIRNEL
jgi:hypothetical protein